MKQLSLFFNEHTMGSNSEASMFIWALISLLSDFKEPCIAQQLGSLDKSLTSPFVSLIGMRESPSDFEILDLHSSFKRMSMKECGVPKHGEETILNDGQVHCHLTFFNVNPRAAIHFGIPWNDDYLYNCTKYHEDDLLDFMILRAQREVMEMFHPYLEGKLDDATTEWMFQHLVCLDAESTKTLIHGIVSSSMTEHEIGKPLLDQLCAHLASVTSHVHHKDGTDPLLATPSWKGPFTPILEVDLLGQQRRLFISIGKDYVVLSDKHAGSWGAEVSVVLKYSGTKFRYLSDSYDVLDESLLSCKYLGDKFRLEAHPRCLDSFPSPVERLLWKDYVFDDKLILSTSMSA